MIERRTRTHHVELAFVHVGIRVKFRTEEPAI